MASSSDSFNKSQQAAISYGMWWSRFSVNSRQMDICFLDHRMLSFKASHSLYISSFGKTKKKLFSHAAVGPLRSSKWKNLCNALFYYYYILCIICAKRKEKCFKRVCFVSLLSLEKENVGSQWTRKLQTHCQSIASIFHRPFGLTCFFFHFGKNTRLETRRTRWGLANFKSYDDDCGSTYQAFNETPALCPHLFDVSKDVHDSVFFRQLDVGVYRHVHTGATGAVAEKLICFVPLSRLKATSRKNCWQSCQLYRSGIYILAVYDDWPVLAVGMVIHDVSNSPPEFK